MRNYDSWNRYLDNKGNPLHGCVQFMVKDGNTVAPIYNSDGTPLSNPILTDIYGRTQYQVFVDVDVVAYFYSYIGNGVWNTQLDIDTSDISKWSLQYTIENQNSMSRVIDSTGTTCVPTIEALRNLNVEDVPLVNGMKVITLLGYYNQGDKEPINYYWDAESSEPDDDGSVIKYEGEITGRWIMVQPTEHCDTRHFGVFPANSYNTGDQTYGIIKCFEYCNKKSIKPFFNGSEDYRWFKFTNLNVHSEFIDISEGTRFYDLGNNTIEGEWNGTPNFVQHNTNVIAKNVKTSWGAKSYTGYKNVVLDVYTDQTNWQDAHIDVQYSPCYGYNFTHCSFEDNGNIGSDNVNGINNTFNNCKLNERMFILSGDYTVSLVNLCVNCQIDPDDFRNSMWLYKQIRCTSDGNHFFDYRDFPNVGKPYENYVGNKLTGDTIYVSNLKNLVANKVRITKLPNQTTIMFDNCIGWYEIPANMAVVVKDSNVKLSLGSKDSISATNSTIDLVELPTDFANALTANFKDCSISGVIGVYDSFGANNCTLTAPVDATNGYFYSTSITSPIAVGYTDIKDCNIGNLFAIYGVVGDTINVPNYQDDMTIQGYLPCNRFVGGNIKDNFVSGQIILGITDPNNGHYAANWLARNLNIIGNTGLSANPIAINRGYCTVYENFNTYIYKNNTGNFPGHNSTTLHYNSTNYKPYGDTYTHYFAYFGKIDNWVEPHTGDTGHTDPNVYMCTFNAFSVGTKFTRFKMNTYIGGTQYEPQINPKKMTYLFFGTTTVLDTVERSKQEYDDEAGTQSPWPRDLTFVDGFTWKITKWEGFMGSSGGFGTTHWSTLGPFEFDAEPVTPWYPGLN